MQLWGTHDQATQTVPEFLARGYVLKRNVALINTARPEPKREVRPVGIIGAVMSVGLKLGYSFNVLIAGTMCGTFFNESMGK